jgi:hypothetical protein
VWRFQLLVRWLRRQDIRGVVEHQLPEMVHFAGEVGRYVPWKFVAELDAARCQIAYGRNRCRIGRQQKKKLRVNIRVHDGSFFEWFFNTIDDRQKHVATKRIAALDLVIVGRLGRIVFVVIEELLGNPLPSKCLVLALLGERFSFVFNLVKTVP